MTSAAIDRAEKIAEPSAPPIGYRPMPANFAALFIEHGWEGIEFECRAHKTTIKRWLVAYGEEELRRRRREFLEARYAERGHRVPGRKPGTAGRYVMGRTRNG